MKDIVHQIRPENFTEEVTLEKRPVLLFCMPFGDTFPEQMKVIKDIAASYPKELKVGVID